MLQLNYLIRLPSFFENVSPRVIISTSLNTGELKNLPPDLCARIAEIKRATGNTTNDVDINGHHYDFKITTDACFS
jgi:hypothetical protein